MPLGSPVDTRPKQAGVAIDEQEKLMLLRRENRELNNYKEILRNGTAYFSQVNIDRRPK